MNNMMFNKLLITLNINTIMGTTYVKKQTAILLKDIGFNEITDLFFNEFYPKGATNINGLTNYDAVTGKRDNFTSLPIQSEVQKWFREVHNIHIEILLSDEPPYNEYYYRLMEIGKYFTLSHNGVYNTIYEDSLEAAIIAAIDLIPVKNQ